MNLEDGRPIIGPLKFFLIQVANNLISTFFLVIWVLAQFLLSRIVALLEPSGLDAIILGIFQIFFGISTITPIAINFIRDTKIAWIRAQNSVDNVKSAISNEAGKEGSHRVRKAISRNELRTQVDDFREDKFEHEMKRDINSASSEAD